MTLDSASPAPTIAGLDFADIPEPKADTPEPPAPAAGDGEPAEVPEPSADEKPEKEKAAEADETASEPEAAEEPSPAPDKEPFVFAGRQFKDTTSAEHYLKTQEGRVKAFEKREKALESQVEEANKLARGWYEHAQKLQNGSAPPQGKTGKADTPAEPERSDITPLDKLPWDQYEEIAEKHGTKYAGYWLAAQIEKRTEAQIQRAVQKATEPLVQERASKQQIEARIGLFTEVGDQTGDDGAPLFPELREETAVSPEEAEKILGFWRALPEAFRETREGVEHAVLKYRLQAGKGGKSGSSGNGRAAGAPSGAAVLDRLKNAASESLSGNGGAPQPGAGQPANTPKQSFVRPVVAADGKGLGFYAD